MKKMIKYMIILTLTVLMFTGCASSVESPTEDKNEADAINYTSKQYEETDSAEEESETEETESEFEPEWTVWDGKGEIRKSEQREFAEYQYKDGVAYHIGNIPLVERTSGKYPGKAYAERFYMTDDIIYYMEDDGTSYITPNESYSMTLFAQPLQGNGDDVMLLDEHIFYAAYQDGVILTAGKEKILKKFDAETGNLISQFDINTLGEDLYWTLFDKDYLIYHTAQHDKYLMYNFESKENVSIYIPDEYIWQTMWDWKGNIFSKHYNDDNTVNIVQLYEQGNPVWRIFPNEIPQRFSLSNGKAFYDNGSGEVMEYNLETNEVRKVCDLEPDEYDEDNFRGGRQDFIEAYEDNGGVFITEMNGYDLFPNVFKYFVDSLGNKTLILRDFSS